jgi:hypothetical protein
MEFDEDVAFVQPHRKSKEHKFWIYPQLNTRRERGIFYTVFGNPFFFPP